MTIDSLTPSGQCMIVDIYCKAPKVSCFETSDRKIYGCFNFPVQDGETVSLISPNGVLNSAVNRTNVTIRCNNGAQWETTGGTVIDTLSCGYMLGKDESIVLLYTYHSCYFHDDAFNSRP